MLIRPSLVAIALLALCACGLRGPLYLPGDKQQTESGQAATGSGGVKSQRPAPAPQSQKRDRDAEKNGDAEPVPSPDPDRPATTPPPGN